MSTGKKVIVLGQDSASIDTLIGSLIYKCGMDIRLLQDLERNAKQRYGDIPNFMRQKGLPLDFEAKSGRCTVSDDVQDADVVLYLVKITTPLEENVSFLRRVSLPAKAGKARKAILVDDMEKNQWSNEQFNALRQAIDEYLRVAYDAQASWNVIPVSSASGDNILEHSSQAPWYSARNDALVHGRAPCTVIEEIDG